MTFWPSEKTVKVTQMSHGIISVCWEVGTQCPFSVFGSYLMCGFDYKHFFCEAENQMQDLACAKWAPYF